jgi:NOL1/NOP2/fmu family ribosome biogenesis protein
LSDPQPFLEIDGEPYAVWWGDRFAPPADPFSGMRFYRRGRAKIWVGTAAIEGLAGVRVDAVGIHLLRVGRRLWKPTSAAIIAFGGDATRNAIDLDRGDAASFLRGEPLLLGEDDERRAGVTAGFVAVRLEGVALGCGEWRRDTLLSCVPKARQGLEIDP